VSKWHFNNLIAIINLHQLQRGKLFIISQSNFQNKSKYRLSRNYIEDYKYLFSEITFIETIYWKKTKIFKNLFLNPFFKEKVLMITPGGINYGLLGNHFYKKKIKFCIIDEGTASHISPLNHLRISLKTTNHSVNLNIYFRRVLRVFIDKIIHAIFKPFDNKLFYKRDANFLVNKKISRELRRVYQQKNKNIKISERNILLIFDFFDKISDAKSIFDLYKSILKTIPEDYHVFIKPHPNDLNKYAQKLVSERITILDSRKDVESIVAEINPTNIISGISTSSFSIPAIFNIKTISFIPLYLKIPQIDQDYKIRFEYFLNHFSHYLILPKSLNNISQILKK
tara:strand:- start:853 stop:1872 length:1020 start_codon:yes stop_codon:yes gene_type:complete